MRLLPALTSALEFGLAASFSAILTAVLKIGATLPQVRCVYVNVHVHGSCVARVSAGFALLTHINIPLPPRSVAPRRRSSARWCCRPWSSCSDRTSAPSASTCCSISTSTPTRSRRPSSTTTSSRRYACVPV